MQPQVGWPPFSEETLLLLHRIATAYGTDPGSVLSWSPFRIGLAIECLEAAAGATMRLVGAANARGEMIFPVVSVGA